MPINYIMPDWDDYLDTGFDFQKDTFSVSKDGVPQRSYLHEILGDNTPYDGILVSLNQIDKKKGALKKYDVIGADKDIRKIMRIPKRIKVIGDCGAFSYKDRLEPSIDPKTAARLYDEYGFDMGASVDHMIVDEVITKNAEGKDEKRALTDEEKAKRVTLTKKNASAFINEVRTNNYRFTPLGSIQARTPQEYAQVFDEYIEMGYRQIALGSLIPKDDETIREIIKEVGTHYKALPEDIRKDVGIHLFGILRPALFSLYAENGIASFDSASYFRKAWLKSDRNYLGANGEWYAAIRVPQSALPKNKKALENKGFDLEEVATLEKKVLQSLNGFNKESDVEAILDDIINYDSYFDRVSDGGEKLRGAYRRVLTDRPWEQCQCAICQEIGIHTVIFRGYNRNKRRGFHNTYVFYHQYNGGEEYEH